MKSAARSPAFRPQAFGVTECICIRRFRLKAGLQADYLRSLHVMVLRDELTWRSGPMINQNPTIIH